MLIHSLVVCFFAMLQAPVAPVENGLAAVSPEEIKLAIQSLDAPSFDQRELASRTLLRAGKAAEEDLKGAVKTGSAEAKVRASAVLQDILFGITAETSKVEADAIRNFKSLKPTKQSELLKKWLDQGKFELLEKLLAVPEAADARRSLYEHVNQNPSSKVAIIQAERWMWWFDQCKAFRATINRETFVADLLADSDVLKLLEQKKLLPKVQVIFTQLPDDSVRHATFEKLKQVPKFYTVALNEANTEWWFSLIDTLDDKYLRGLTIASFLMSAAEPNKLQTSHMKAMLAYAKRSSDKEGETCVRIALANLVKQTDPQLSKLDGDLLIELCGELEYLDFTTIIDQLFSTHQLQDWMIAPARLRALLPWAAGLNADARDYFVCKLASMYRAKTFSWRQPIESPLAVKQLWDLIQLVADETAKQNALFDFVSALPMQNARNKEIAQQALPLLVANDSTRADETIRRLSQDQSFQQWIYETQWARPLIDRCARMDLETATSGGSYVPIQSLLLNPAAQDYFAVIENRTWLLEQQLPSLDTAAQNQLLRHISNSSVVSQVWGQPQFLETYLNLILHWKDAETSALCYARLIQSAPEDRWLTFTAAPERLQLYKDETLSSQTRASFLGLCLTSASYRDWLSRAKEEEALATLVDQQIAKGDVAFENLLYNSAYVTLMSRTNRLEAWLQFLEGDPARVEKCSRGMFHNLPAALKVALIPHTDRVLKLVEGQQFSHVRSSLAAALLMSPQAIERYASEGKLIDLLKQIDAINSSHYFHPGMINEDLATVIKKHNGVAQLIQALKELPESQSRNILAILMQPSLVDSLAASDQHQRLMEVALAKPQVGKQLLACPPLTEAMIENGYLEKLLEFAPSIDARDNLISQLLTQPTALVYYTKQKQLGQLVRVFDTLSPRTVRDTSLKSLLINSAACEAVCKELGAEQAYQLAESISSENGRAISRAYVTIAAASLQEVPVPWLRQLLEDTRTLGPVGNSVRSSLLQHELMSQMLAAGMFEELKQISLEVSSENQDRDEAGPVTRFYANTAVIEYLVREQQTEQFFQHLKTLSKREELISFTQVCLASDTGMRLLFGSDGFPLLTQAVDNLNASDRLNYWFRIIHQPRLCKVILGAVNDTKLLQYLAANKQLKQPLEQLLMTIYRDAKAADALDRVNLIEETQTLLLHLSDSSRDSLSSLIANNLPITWELVRQDKLPALIKLIESASDEKHRAERISAWILRDGGVISALLAHGRAQAALELLERTNIHVYDRLGRDLAIRSVAGELSAEVERVEKRIEPLSTEDVWWLVNAYRCLQQPDKAKQAALKANDRALQAAVAMESGDWATATSLLTAGPCPLPGLLPRSEEEQTIEQQTLLMLSHVYQNHPADAQQCLDRLLAIRDQTKDGYSRSRCVNAMLFAGQIEAGLQYNDKVFPERSISIRPQQGNYQPIIDYVSSFNSDAALVIKDLDLRSRNPQILAGWVAELIAALNQAGKDDVAQRLHQAMMEHLRSKDTTKTWLFNYSSQLFLRRQMDLYWSSLEEVDNISLVHRPVVDPQKMNSSSFDLQSGLVLLILDRPTISSNPVDRPAIIAALRRIDDEKLAEQVPQEQLNKWIHQALESSEVLYKFNSVRFAIGYLCLQQGDKPHGYQILEPLAAENASAAEVLATDAWKRKAWKEAATYYSHLRRLNHARLDAFYLSALAQQRAATDVDAVAQADAALQAATTALYEPSAMLNLANKLFELDEKELGLQFAQKALHTSPVDFWNHLQATKLLLTQATTPQDQLQWGRQWQLAQSRYMRRVHEQSELICFPAIIYSAQAELGFADKNWDVVERQLDLHQQCLRNDKAFNTLWSARLKQNDRSALAEKLFPGL